jgi:hypothetical protein
MVTINIISAKDHRKRREPIALKPLREPIACNHRNTSLKAAAHHKSSFHSNHWNAFLKAYNHWNASLKATMHHESPLHSNRQSASLKRPLHLNYYVSGHPHRVGYPHRVITPKQRNQLSKQSNTDTGASTALCKKLVYTIEDC